MKRFALYTLLVVFSNVSFAQKDTMQALELSINPGMNYRLIGLNNQDLNWLKDTQDSLQKPMAGYGFQINHEFGITEKRSFFMGVAYSRQGYAYKKNALEGFRSYAVQHQFVQIPIGFNAYYRLNERLQLAVQPSLLPGALIATSARYVEQGDQLVRKMETYPRSVLISLHAQLAAGIVARIDQHWKFRASLIYQQQLKAVDEGGLNVRLFNAGIQLALSRSINN